MLHAFHTCRVVANSLGKGRTASPTSAMFASFLRKQLQKTVYMKSRIKLSKTDAVQETFYSSRPRRLAAEAVRRLRTIFLCASTRMRKFRVACATL